MPSESESSVLRVDVEGVDLAVEVTGKGRTPVLFVHGLGANRRCWYRARDYFDLSRYRLIIPDFPGFGESARPTDYDYSMSALGHCLHRVLGATDCSRFHVVVHSMGCAATLAMLKSHARLPLSFVAAEGNLVAEDAFMSSKVARLSESVFLRSYSKWVAMVRSSLGDEPNEQHELFVESLRHASPLAVYRASVSCQALTRAGELSQQYAGLRCPLAYAYGAETPKQRPLPEVALLPKVEQIAVLGQGHFMMQDADSFYGSVADFIQRQSEDPAAAEPH